ncbi:MAG: hypothetical protein LUQ50_07820 [Methanospirillum sp.]|uniref:glutamine amidotransferase-related protein n=1 Tax=Methanospirillum sp. TaxID=45200 RepID=UPI00236C5C81|nr:hypothetical protein [Methanospirillum sp.]MDD1728963.1 hypothetical protein [Methanospirillum sp.]
MIAILDCTRQDLPLLKREFVSPVVSIVERSGHQAMILPLATTEVPVNLQGVILTGTALMDDHYLLHGIPEWLMKWTGPVLGICAGMQLIVIAGGGIVIPSEKIGMTEIMVTSDEEIFSGKERFNAWELHQSGVMPTESMKILARSEAGVQAVRCADRPWYGVLFHPEVRNEWIIINFLEICSQHPHNNYDLEIQWRHPNSQKLLKSRL